VGQGTGQIVGVHVEGLAHLGPQAARPPLAVIRQTLEALTQSCCFRDLATDRLLGRLILSISALLRWATTVKTGSA
jgi:hypothetical protein